MKRRLEIAIALALATGSVQPALAQQSTVPAQIKSTPNLFSSPKEDELLEPDQAFRLNISIKGPNTILADLMPAKGYYLYKEKIRFSLKDGNGAVISAVKLPAGEMKTDQIFGKTEVYRKPIPAELTLKRGPKTGKVTLVAFYQGCHEKLGVCYAPIEKAVSLVLP